MERFLAAMRIRSRRSDRLRSSVSALLWHLPTAFQPPNEASNHYAHHHANHLRTATNRLPTACFQPPIPPMRLEGRFARAFSPGFRPALRCAALAVETLIETFAAGKHADDRFRRRIEFQACPRSAQTVGACSGGRKVTSSWPLHKDNAELAISSPPKRGSPCAKPCNHRSQRAQPRNSLSSSSRLLALAYRPVTVRATPCFPSQCPTACCDPAIKPRFAGTAKRVRRTLC